MKLNTLSALAFSALLLSSCGGSFPEGKERIKADQIGYQVGTVKIAIVPDSTDGEFQLLDMEDNVVFTGKTQDARQWEFSGTSVKLADFSGFNREGLFYLRCKGAKDSYPFAIGHGIYHQLSHDAVKSYYYARSGMEITEQYGGKYARPLAHPDNHVIIHESAAGPKRKAGDIISSPGGWYDAGDYNKYIVNSSISVWEILNAVELYPEYSRNLKLNIPESGNAIPDVVDELLYNLRWMITMQDPDDGGVYHKLTQLKFCGMVMPEEDKDDRYVIQKSTSAALDLAATCAKAYRVLEPYNSQLPGLRDSLMSVADKAWNWAQKNPGVLFKDNPEGVSTGTYGDSDIRDEFLWASIEMALAKGDAQYVKNVDDLCLTVPSWDSVSALGVISALNDQKYKDLFDADFYDRMKNALMAIAEKCLGTYSQSAYATSLDIFPWGSNSEVANHGLVLVTAYKLIGDSKYLEAAQAALHYILGRNPMDICYVSGFGCRAVRNPHDRRSVADGVVNPVPGLLCGGPYANAHGDVPDSLYLYTAPAMRYVDDYRSFTTNEIAINWNSALVFLSFAIDSESIK